MTEKLKKQAGHFKGGNKKWIPLIEKNSEEKVGVNCGDQRMKDKPAFADQIKYGGCSLKGVVHQIQQSCHQGFLGRASTM